MLAIPVGLIKAKAMQGFARNPEARGGCSEESEGQGFRLRNASLVLEAPDMESTIQGGNGTVEVAPRSIKGPDLRYRDLRSSVWSSMRHQPSLVLA